MSQEFTTTDLMRLEVAQTPTGLINLIQNPSGELGGWGWITPLSGSLMQGGVDVDLGHGSGTSELLYSSPSSGVSYFYSEPFAVTAGQYVGARWYMTYSTGGSAWVRARFEFLNAAGSVISSSTQTAYFGTGTNVAGAVVAPATTTSARLRFDVYSSNAGANSGGGHLHMKEVTVAKAATSGEIGAVRTNYVRNPSFETNTTGWSNGTNGGIGGSITTSRPSDTPYVGTYYMRAQLNSGGSGNIGIRLSCAGSSGPTGLTGGQDYVVSAMLKGGAGVGATVKMWWQWKNAAGSVIATELGTTVALPGSWTSVSLVRTAPSTATSMNLLFDMFDGTPNPKFLDIDAVMVEQASALGSYFDGSTTDAGGIDYAWTGTAHDSASTASQTVLPFIEPVLWQNILGPTHDIKVERQGLNLGTLTATVLDSALDPSQSNLIRPGKQVRLSTQVDSVWEPIFTGRIQNGSVEYHLLRDDQKRARIALTATDSIGVLTQHKRPQGVAAIDHLRWVLEGAGTPWNVNGSGSQLNPDPAVVSTNDNASALDQIAVTRDSNLGYAWVDRRNVIQAWDSASLSATVKYTADETDYSDIKIDYDTDRCINSVTVKRLVLQGEDTTEVVHGPYVDQDSIDEWGPHTAEFTVQGISEASVAAYAASILAANAVPTLRINSVTMPLRTTGDVEAKALTDLYDLLNVENTSAGLDDDLRVTGIRHAITPDKWLMTLTFDNPGGVASPQVYPPVQNGDAEGWIAPTLSNGWVNYTGGWEDVGYRKINGIVYIRGLIRNGNPQVSDVFQLPVGYRPATDMHIPAMGQASTFAAINIFANGIVRVNANSNGGAGTGYVSLRTIPFPAEA